MRLKLIANWRDAWRWFSIHCAVLAGIVQTAWAALPDDMRQSIPPHLVTRITLVLLALLIFGRLTTIETKDKDQC